MELPQVFFRGEVFGPGLSFFLQEEVLQDQKIHARRHETPPGVLGRKDDGFPSASFFAKTDAQGRFRIQMEKREGPPAKGTLTLSIPQKGLEARAALTFPLPPGVTNLGDLTLVPLPFLAEGKVVDPSGKPLAGAAVRAYPANRVYGPHDPSFLAINRMPSVTDAHGRFRLRGKAKTGKIRLKAARKGWIQKEPVLVPRGSKGVTLVLHKGGSLEAVFLLDPGISLEKVHLSLTTRNGALPRSFQPKIEKNKALWEGLPAGIFVLQVRIGLVSSVLAEIPGIAVEEGKKTRDPRLNPVDLRGKIRILRLDVVDASGKKVRPFYTGFDKESGDSSFLFPGNGTLFLPMAETARLFVTAPGYRGRVVSLTGGKVRVVLEKGIEVRLSLAEKEVIPDPPLRLGVGLMPLPRKKGGPPRLAFLPFTGDIRWFDREGILTFHLSFPGKYRVFWTLSENSGNGGNFPEIGEKEKNLIQVEDRPGPQVITVHAPVKAIRKAMESMKKE